MYMSLDQQKKYLNKESILLEAKVNGDMELAHQLLKNGVNINCKDHYERGPLLSFISEIIEL